MQEKVLIFRCADYEPNKIAQVIGQGMDELGIVPNGRTIIKPNVVIAHKFYFPNAFTQPEFVDGLLSAVKARGAEIQELAVGERSGITIPTRFAFSQAGYKKVLRKHNVKAYYFDECFQVERQLRHPDRLRDYIYIPQPIDECDFFINAPKLKSHSWTRITAALKNLMGLQDDRHRLIDHDHLLEYKIADLQEIIQPQSVCDKFVVGFRASTQPTFHTPSQFIAVDAIVAGEMKMLTPEPYPLGAILMGTNPAAIDAVACHIIGFDPRNVIHLRLSHERGYGPIDLAKVELGGDFPLEEIQEIASKFRVPTERVEAVLNKTSNITTYVGKPPEPEKMDYCWGGCPGALIEAMEIVRTIQPDVYQEVKPLHFVFGNYEGEIDAKPWERIIFCGDCAQFKGTICDNSVEIKSEYMPRDKKDPHTAKSKDLIVRMNQFVLNTFRNRKNQVLRARGCPVSVAENIMFLWKAGDTKNPYLDSRVVFPFYRSYLVSKLMNLIRILFRRCPKRFII